MIKSILSCVNWKTLFYGLVCLLFPIVAYVIYIGVALSLLLGLIYIIKRGLYVKQRSTTSTLHSMSKNQF